MTQARKIQRGLATVEAAVCFLVLGVMLLVVVDFGRAMFFSITTSNAARAGVGYGAQATALAIDHVGMNAAAQADAQDLKQDAKNPSHVSSTARHFCRCPGGGGEVSCTSSGCGAPEVYVEVTTSRVFDTMVDYPGFPADLGMQWTAVMRVQ